MPDIGIWDMDEHRDAVPQRLPIQNTAERLGHDQTGVTEMVLRWWRDDRRNKQVQGRAMRAMQDLNERSIGMH